MTRFGAGHSSTSISAAVGFAMARELGAETGDAVAVIGDGAMSGGMAFEAMNHAGHLGKRVFVVLNDNEMSIAPPVGALSSYLTRLYSEGPMQDLKAVAKGAVSLLPEPFQEGARRAKEMLKGMAMGGTLFEELGFTYVGPVDGHDLDTLLPLLRTLKARATGPVLIHALTKKGKGYAPAEGPRRPRPRHREIRRGDRRAGENPLERAELHEGFRRKPDRAGRAGREDRRGDRGDGLTAPG